MPTELMDLEIAPASPGSQQEPSPERGNLYSLTQDYSTLFSELSLNLYPIHTLSTLLEGANTCVPSYQHKKISGK